MIFDGEFTTLLQALDAADPGIKQRLADPSMISTLLAPTDQAFAALGDEAIQALLDDQKKLNDLLRYHTALGVVPTSRMIWDISQNADNASIETMREGGPHRIKISRSEDGGIVLNGSVNIVVHDVDAGNGMIHVI